MLCATPSGATTRNGRKTSATTAASRPRQTIASRRPAPPPDVGRGHGNEHGRIELHRDRSAEHAEAETVAPVDEGGERAGDERRRPEVEAGEHDRAEQEREAGGEREHEHGPGPRGPQAPRARRPVRSTMAAPQAAISHSKASRKPSSSSLSKRRQHERRECAGRVLGTDVAIRHRTVLDRIAVALVDRDVDDLALVVPRRVQDAPRRQKERRRGDRRELSEPSRTGHVGRGPRRRRRGRTTGCRDRTSASARARIRSGRRR